MTVIICTMCDEFGFIAGLPKKVFFNNEAGRAGLWEEIQQGLERGLFEANDLDELKNLVLEGNIKEAQKHLRYASLTMMPGIG